MRLLVTPTTAIPPLDLNSGPLLPPSLNRKFITRTFDSDTYYPGRVSGLRGLGQASTVQTAEAIAATGAQTTISLLVAFSSITGPVGAALAAVVAIGFAVASMFKGCGQVCVQASNYANQVESQLLQPNLSAYLSSPIRTVSMQAAALNNYNTAIASLEQACGQAQLAQAGKNCIDERVNVSSCQWKAKAGGWTQNSDGTCTYTPWGASGSGNSCWNWVIGYHDPIANDPCVQPDSVLLTSSGATGSDTSSTTTTSGSTSNPLSTLTDTLTNTSVSIGSASIPLWMLIGGGLLALMAVEK